MADERPFIRVHDGMPDHPKVDVLSDKAFRLLVSSWCWCNRQRTDGRIPAARWKKQATPKARRELIAAGLAEELPAGDVQMHDYLDWQRSATEIAELKAAKSQGGSFGNHKRWHLDRGIQDPDCTHCAIAPPIGEPIRPPITNGSESDRKPIASSSESDQGPTVPRSGSVDHHLRPETREASDDDEELDKITAKIEGRIIELLNELTGRVVDRGWASKIRRQLLDDRDIKNPLGYVASAIRGEPQKYLPASTARQAGNAVIAEVRSVDLDQVAAAAKTGAAEARKLMAASRKSAET